MSINRRKVLGGAGLAGAAAVTGAGVDRLLIGDSTGFRESTGETPSPIADDLERLGDPRIPAETLTSRSHLFRFGAEAPVVHDGGSFRQASGDNFPILRGQQASVVLLTLQPGGIREPHWHPSAWEINIVTSGVAAWVVIDGNGYHETFDQHAGDVVFAPQGSFHYFENRGTEDMKIVIIQNTSAAENKDNLGIGQSLSKIPTRVLSSIFGVPDETFSSFTKFDSSIVILRAR